MCHLFPRGPGSTNCLPGCVEGPHGCRVAPKQSQDLVCARNNDDQSGTVGAAEGEAARLDCQEEEAPESLPSAAAIPQPGVLGGLAEDRLFQGAVPAVVDSARPLGGLPGCGSPGSSAAGEPQGGAASSLTQHSARPAARPGWEPAGQPAAPPLPVEAAPPRAGAAPGL